MSIRVLKYQVPAVDSFTLGLPASARFLSVQEQNQLAQMWFEVDMGEQPGVRYFQLVMTGGEVPHAGAYLGTFQTHNGHYVIHLYEVTK